MTRGRQHGCRFALLVLFFACWLPMILDDYALGTDLPLTGGSGGNLDRSECPRGSYLVGLAGRTGEWVERIAPVCAPWLRSSQTFGAPTVGKFLGTGGGGQEVQSELIGGIPARVCRGVNTNNIIAVRVWHIDTLRSQNRFVQHIEVGCMSLTTPLDTGFLTFGPRSADAEERVAGMGNLSPCPAGEGIVGIHGRFGLFVDALGLICGPLPASLGAPVTKLPGPRVQAPSRAQSLHPQAKNMQIPADMYVIVRPGAGDKIPHGQLVITATEPKVGSTDVVELELRYLDAPVNQQHAYPYTTIVSVNKAQLSTGYPVTERVTGGYVGRWQVRARSTMKTPQGSWSFPVQFHMVKAPPPPPMVQTPKLNAPITQTPAPGSSAVQAPAPSGATTQMWRSPSMIMPRGVDGDESKDGSETAATTPETEKKP